MENIFCLESHIHLCSRHTSAIPAYVIKTCVTWHAISGTRYWGFVSPKLHVSTYRNQQHCWWFHHRYASCVFAAIRDTNLRCRQKAVAAVDIVCFYPLIRVYHWLSTANCKAVMISGCLLPWHDCHLDVQWNTLAAWETIHSGFPVTPNQWKRERLNSEKCLKQSRRTREMCRTNRAQWCWAALGCRYN